MPQAVKIVSQSEQQSLTALRRQAAARRTARQFAFGNREDGLDQGTTAILLAGKRRAHLRTNAVNGPGLLPPLRRDDTASMKLLANESVVPLGVELGIGQHAADRSMRMGFGYQSGQVGAIVPRGSACRLRQDELPLEVDDDQPLQPVPPGQGLLGVVVRTAHEERAHRALSKPSGIDGCGSATSGTGQGHTTNHFLQGLCNGSFVQPPQEAVECGVVGNRAKPESTAQFQVLRQPHLCFPEGPVLVAHEAQDRQQLRLRELVFAKRRAITRHRGLRYIQCHVCESHQTNFGHSQQGVSPELIAA
jgi:hypothetical protein